MAYTKDGGYGDLIPVTIPADKIIKPPWTEVKYELEHNREVSFQGAFSFSRVTYFITNEDFRSYTKISFIKYAPGPYFIDRIIGKFPYTEKGYNDAFKLAVANLDDDKRGLLDISRENMLMRNAIKSRMKVIEAVHRKKDEKYADPKFLEYRRQVVEYARHLGTKKYVTEAILRDEFDKTIYVAYRADIHYMDLALDFFNENVELDSLNLQDKTNFDRNSNKRKKTRKRAPQPSDVSKLEYDSFSTDNTEETDENVDVD